MARTCSTNSSSRASVSMEDLCWCCIIRRCLRRDDGVSKMAEPGDVTDVISELLRAVPLSVPESTWRTVAWDSFQMPSEWSLEASARVIFREEQDKRVVSDLMGRDE